jgi:hypothetical protein
LEASYQSPSVARQRAAPQAVKTLDELSKRALAASGEDWQQKEIDKQSSCLLR